jgi:hypothetical protein
MQHEVGAAENPTDKKDKGMAMNRRTIREFPCSEDLWPIVESWAAQTGFIEREKTADRRLYRKRNLAMAPAFLEIRREGRRVVLEAWVKADMFLILSFLAGQKPEAAIESGGLTAAIPRQRAREAINQLLIRLSQKPIA